MKTLLFFLTFLLIGAEVTSEGAQTAPDLKALSSSSPEFRLDETTLTYNRLGFGDYDTLYRFSMDQIGFLTLLIEDKNGNRDFNVSLYEFSHESETFAGFVARTTALQLKHAIDVAHFPTNEQLKLRYWFKSRVSITSNSITQSLPTTQLFTDYIPFVPEFSNGEYIVPRVVLESLKLKMDAGGRQQIPYPYILGASLEVNHGSTLVYKGNSSSLATDPNLTDPNLTIYEGYYLLIGRKFLTNGYTGVLTVRHAKGRSVYRLQDGMMVPLMSINHKAGLITVTVKGLPFQNIRLFRHVSPNSLPLDTEDFLSLDSNGSGKWTNKITSSAGFFSASPLSFEESTKQSIKR